MNTRETLDRVARESLAILASQLSPIIPNPAWRWWAFWRPKMIWSVDVRCRMNAKRYLRDIRRRTRRNSLERSYLNTRIALVNWRFATDGNRDVVDLVHFTTTNLLVASVNLNFATAPIRRYFSSSPEKYFCL